MPGQGLGHPHLPGKLAEEQLQQALESQKGNPGGAGQSAGLNGFISEADAQAQAQRLDLDYVELTEGTTAKRSTSCRRSAAQA